MLIPLSSGSVRYDRRIKALDEISTPNSRIADPDVLEQRQRTRYLTPDTRLLVHGRDRDKHETNN